MAGAHADIGGGYQLVEKCTLLMDEEYCGSVSADEFRQRGECALPQQREHRAREAILERVRQKGLLVRTGGCRMAGTSARLENQRRCGVGHALHSAAHARQAHP